MSLAVDRWGMKQMREYYASANKMAISMNEASAAVMEVVSGLIAK